MLVFMMLLFVLLAAILLIQFRIYSRSSHKVLSADTSLTETFATTLQTPVE
jgi:carbon starvation protein CstA